MTAHVLTSEAAAPTLGKVARVWAPLAVSWLMIIVEGPLIVALTARLPDAEINLAALGGIVRALTFAIESPILMLLTASAALSKTSDAYLRLRKYTFWGIGVLTIVHLALTLTPLYYVVTEQWIGAPAEIIEPGRIGMIITIPYLAFVAHRRFNHGLLIRFGYSRAIAEGTFVRLLSVLGIMTIGLIVQSVSGVVVAALTMTVGVTIEALYIEWRVRPVVSQELKPAAPTEPPLTVVPFLRFYIPLAMTSVAMFVMQPVVSAALSRMPDPIVSLAVWSPVIGVAMLLASAGTPIVDVVVTFLDKPLALPVLRRFTAYITVVTAALGLLLAATPLGLFWFGTLSALTEPILSVAREAFWFALLFPVARAVQAFHQGILTYARRTQRITEAVVINVVVTLAILWAGASWGGVRGIFIGVGATTAATIFQTGWMWWRSVPVVRDLYDRQHVIRHRGGQDVQNFVEDRITGAVDER